MIRGAPRQLLDDKVAQSSVCQYDSGKVAQWVLKVRNYVVGVYPELMQLLKWSEDQQHREIKSTDVPPLKDQYMLDVDPVLLSQRLWSWIQLCLKDDDNTALAFNNVEPFPCLQLTLRDISQIVKRRYLLRHVGLEIACRAPTSGGGVTNFADGAGIGVLSTPKRSAAFATSALTHLYLVLQES